MSINQCFNSENEKFGHCLYQQVHFRYEQKHRQSKEWTGNAGKIANVADATSVPITECLRYIFDFRNITIACRLKKFTSKKV